MIAATPSPAVVARARRADLVGLAVLTCLIVAGVLLRLPWLDTGLSSDEIVNLPDAAVRSVLAQPETAVNPPGLRWLVSLAGDPWSAARFGRRFAFACSVGSIALAYAVGRRAGQGSVVVGLLAATLLALHPYPVHDATQLRAYAWWTATALLHVLAMGLAVDAEPGRARRWALAVAIGSAVLLPWIHYFAVPVLLALGAAVLAMPGRRALALAYLPSAAGVLPLIPHVLGGSSQRVAPDKEPVGVALQRLASLELRPVGPVWEGFGKLVEAVTGRWPDATFVLATTTALLLLAGLALTRRLPRTGRLVVAALVGVLVGAGLFAQVQYVRPSTLSIVVTFAAPALPAIVALVPRLRWVALALLATWYGGDLPSRNRLNASAWTVDDGTPWVAAHHIEVLARAGGRPVFVQPRAALWSVWFHLTHTVPRLATAGEGCRDLDPCFDLAGTSWAGIDVVGDGAQLDGIVISEDPWRPAGFASACTAIVDHDTWGVFDCHPPPPVDLPVDPPVDAK